MIIQNYYLSILDKIIKKNQIKLPIVNFILPTKMSISYGSTQNNSET